MEERFDAVVVGMGPGGEVAASLLLDAGLRVAVVERELIGGECGYWACIPSKTLLRPLEAAAEAAGVAGLDRPAPDWPAMRDYRDTMIRHLNDSKQVAGYTDRGAAVYKGAARVVGRDPWVVEVEGRRLRADNVVVATGSAAARPPIEGLEEVELWTNRQATTLEEIPERAVVVGGSAVGVEMGQFLARMGCEVTLVQRSGALMNREEPRVGELAAELLRSDGVVVRTGAEPRRALRRGRDSVLELADGSSVVGDVVLLAAGRVPRVGELGLEGVGVDTGGAGLAVDERCRVAPGLWAVGDVTGTAMFTHVAKYQARVAAANILGRDRTADYTGVPRVVFSDPEIAAVGLTAEQARARGLDVVAAEVDLPAGLARPWTYETAPTGRLGVLADRGGRVLVGAWAVAPLAGEWIHTAALAIREGIGVDRLRDSVAQFPTYSEGYLLAVEALDM
ncbi:NAD(P)/FAD-dependent oxidoreductase [Streptomonospora sp. S1-112]|uniref:NAD(P)/FAD-dependent oxidoreductase n=1 Tax=Streptomonospora mangrovi TaxID=2883123 RepID=A0A9X3NJV6_9ACTN|nr:NAD(P)/FAD-dependent oxidoreductase [Streptomonospora mangrovi]MDA0565087.1 NAD(P)/FAD-dependent oxidoreductase [Streptomonospora mangrovi]